LGQPADSANAVLYLASNEASYVTGTELVIDGGYLSIIKAEMENPVSNTQKRDFLIQ
jgi:enoyl-[acyl-carrier-protein] reductase (NADH)